jgi:hypothetical protein
MVSMDRRGRDLMVVGYTKDEDKQNKNTTQYVLDTTMQVYS